MDTIITSVLKKASTIIETPNRHKNIRKITEEAVSNQVSAVLHLVTLLLNLVQVQNHLNQIVAVLWNVVKRKSVIKKTNQQRKTKSQSLKENRKSTRNKRIKRKKRIQVPQVKSKALKKRNNHSLGQKY